MNKEIKHNIIIFFISILILAGIIYGGYTLIIGRDGVVNKISSVESEFDKNEVLEILTDLVKEKYMDVYKESKDNSDVKLEEAYNTNVAISYLVEKDILEYYYYYSYDENSKEYKYITDGNIDENAQKRDDLYYIKASNIEQVNTYGKGNKFDGANINKIDTFILEKKVDNDVISYEVKYFDQDGKEENVGKLELANPLIK